MGVSEWGTQHDSDSFHFGLRSYDMYGAAIGSGWFGRSETVGVPVSPGVDEIAVALTADVYSRTYRRVNAEISERLLHAADALERSMGRDATMGGPAPTRRRIGDPGRRHPD